MFLRDFIEENHSRQDGFRIPNFLVFHTPPCGNLQTKANTFCIIRTSFKNDNYCSLYSYLFLKGLRISPGGGLTYETDGNARRLA